MYKKKYKMKTEFLILEQTENDIEKHMFGFCSKCMTVYSDNKFSKFGCKTCKRNFFFEGKYKIIIFNIKSLLTKFFDTYESCRSIHYLKKIEIDLKKISENNIFCNYEEKNFCFYFKCKDLNIEKNIKTAWGIYRKFKVKYLKTKVNKICSDCFKINFMNRLHGKEKEILFSFPDNYRSTAHNPAVLPHIHLSREIVERNFKNDLNL